MDDLNSINLGDENNEEPISIEDELEKLIPFDDNTASSTSISHAPLDLGGTEPTIIKPVKPITAKPSQQNASSPDRITGVKTFFTKLHAGAIDFLDTQITEWLRKNPDIVIKRTNTVSGMVVAKKTEPNIIITVWY